MAKKVVIYTTPTCHYCDEAKKFLNENKIKFTAYDVAKDIEKRKEMMEISGSMGVPVITVDGKVMIGFSKEEFKKFLGI